MGSCVEGDGELLRMASGIQTMDTEGQSRRERKDVFRETPSLWLGHPGRREAWSYLLG